MKNSLYSICIFILLVPLVLQAKKIRNVQKFGWEVVSATLNDEETEISIKTLGENYYTNSDIIKWKVNKNTQCKLSTDKIKSWKESNFVTEAFYIWHTTNIECKSKTDYFKTIAWCGYKLTCSNRATGPFCKYEIVGNGAHDEIVDIRQNKISVKKRECKRVIENHGSWGSIQTKCSFDYQTQYDGPDFWKTDRIPIVRIFLPEYKKQISIQCYAYPKEKVMESYGIK